MFEKASAVVQKLFPGKGNSSGPLPGLFLPRPSVRVLSPHHRHVQRGLAKLLRSCVFQVSVCVRDVRGFAPEVFLQMQSMLARAGFVVHCLRKE